MHAAFMPVSLVAIVFTPFSLLGLTHDFAIGTIDRVTATRASALIITPRPVAVLAGRTVGPCPRSLLRALTWRCRLLLTRTLWRRLLRPRALWRALLRARPLGPDLLRTRLLVHGRSRTLRLGPLRRRLTPGLNALARRLTALDALHAIIDAGALSGTAITVFRPSGPVFSALGLSDLDGRGSEEEGGEDAP